MALELPLLENAAQHPFTLLIQNESGLVPSRGPARGEQYGFHFDMTKCIGCKCCVVACNEQNGNPAHLNWRRVGELEGGIYPHVERWHLSMGCNHCLEPSCLKGCPVSAYTKDSVTGIVDHDPDLCIGCQYCVWNCSYGVPQFNEERGVVGKCDMCHGRLNQGVAPACVDACPEQAIRIEIVNLARWRADHRAANAPGMPSAEDSLATTRITLPGGTVKLARVDTHRVGPQEVHWSLILFLIMTQLAVGALAVLAVLQQLGSAVGRFAAALAIVAMLIGILAAPAHLGRPIYAWRAVRNWRTSWLSREVIAFALCAALGIAYTASLRFSLPGSAALSSIAAVLGLAGVIASARLYMVPARPAWNTPFTMTDFLLTCAVLGTRLVLATGVVWAPWILIAAIMATVCQLTNHAVRLRSFARSPELEKQAAAELLATHLRRQIIARVTCSVIALVLVPVSPLIAFLFALCAEFTSRYLFFAAVVPKSVAGTFLAPKESAA